MTSSYDLISAAGTENGDGDIAFIYKGKHAFFCPTEANFGAGYRNDSLFLDGRLYTLTNRVSINAYLDSQVEAYGVIADSALSKPAVKITHAVYGMDPTGPAGPTGDKGLTGDKVPTGSKAVICSLLDRGISC